MQEIFKTINFKQWVDNNRKNLKPPIGNKMIWPNRDFIVMVVGGPNERTDFHVNMGEEFFYQLEGDMTLKIIDEDKKIKDVEIKEGEIFLLPANVPHSPQRRKDTVGLVIERKRRKEEVDGLQWYCKKCSNKLYEESFHLINIETQLTAACNNYLNNKYNICKNCGTENGKTW